MAKECEYCGAENPTRAQFCAQCGKPWSEPWLRSATRLTPLMQQWRKLRHRMTRREVKAALGEPARLDVTTQGAASRERWQYAYVLTGGVPEDAAASADIPPSGTPPTNGAPPSTHAPLVGVLEFELPDGVLATWTEPEWARLGPVA